MTLPTTINDIEDLYHILEVYPQWREALRRELLTAELVAMPETLAQLVPKIDRLAEQTADNSRLIAENSRQIEENSKQVAENSRQISELRVIADNYTARMARLESDNSELKSLTTEARAADLSYIIAAWLDWEQPIQLNKAELTELVHNQGLTREVRASFIAADLVFHAQDDAGNDAYCAVAISWTVNQYDIDRAERNADLLKRLTGCPCRAAVCGERHERNLNWGNVLWIPRKQ